MISFFESARFRENYDCQMPILLVGVIVYD